MTARPAPRRHTRSLREGWVFAPQELDSSTSIAELRALGEPITVPHTWNAVDGQLGGNYRRGRSTYARRIEALLPGHRTWIEFEGVNSSAEVHLDGVLLARHDGGYSTFRVDVTDHLKDGAGTLVVVVDNAPNETVYPQQADFTFYGGIYREVRQITVDPVHVALDHHGGPGLSVTPHIDGTRAQVEVLARITGAADGTEVRLGIDGESSATVTVRDGVAVAMLSIEQLRRWHGLRDPHLYTARAEVLRAGSPVDAVELRFGCREFEVDPQRGFLLNGEEYPLRGVSRHQDWEGVGNVLSEEMMQTDLALLRELGATTVRLAHYQHAQRFLDLCDDAGIVVWAEIPQITVFLPGATQNAEQQLTELIVQNAHHPSIITWGLSNEITLAGSGEDVLSAHRELHAHARELDPTRLTAMANLFLLETDHPLVTVPDVMSYNLYFGWYVGEMQDNDSWLDRFHAENPTVAIGLAEYGADANLRIQSADPARGDYSEGYQARYHEHMIEMIDQRPWLWATHVWNLADFGAAGRDEGGATGRNQKGLVTFDRSQKKDAFYVYKAAWSEEPFVHLAGRRRRERAEAKTEVVVYSNQSKVTLIVDGEEFATAKGHRFFRFSVPLDGDHEITARAGELTDTITLRKVSEVEPPAVASTTSVANWFEDTELPAPPGRFSIRDTLGEIKQTAEGERLMSSILETLATSRGDVGKGVQIPSAMQEIVDRMSVEKLLKQAGGLPAEQVAELNSRLNLIEK